MYARRQALSTSGYARQTYLAGRQSQSINQGAGLVTAQRTSTNELTVKWSGDPSNVQRIYFATLDANGQVIEQKAVTQLPVQANLNLNNGATQLGVQIVYANGTSNTAYSPIL